MKKFGVALLLSVSFSSFAQQPQIFNQFYMNPYLYNPAYAGVEGHTAFYAIYNQQWSKIADAPTVIHTSFHTPLEGGIGIGAAIYNEQRGGLINSIAGKASASYLITMDRKHHLRFGMSVGGGTQSLNFGELDDPSDPAFGNIGEQTSYMLADFGATYHFDHFNVGFSIPNLVSYDIFQPGSFDPIRVKPLDNLMVKMNYRGHINDDIAIEPHVIYRYNKHLQSQYEATVIFHIYHVVWTSVTYRQDKNIVASAGVKIKEKLGVGYSFEMGNTSISSQLGPSHEIHIGYHFGGKKKHASHTSSFIKSHRLSAEQRAQKAAQEREKELQALQQSRETAPQNTDELSIARPASTTAAAGAAAATASNTPTTPEEKNWEVDEQWGEVERTNEFGESEKAVVIKHTDENGELQEAVAWVPADENWELVDEPALSRTAADGSSEIGVKYNRTNAEGESEVVVKWEPVVTSEQVAVILAGASTASTLANAAANQAPVEQFEAEAVVPQNTEQESVIEERSIETENQPSQEVNTPVQDEPIDEVVTNQAPVNEQPTPINEQPSTVEPPEEQVTNEQLEQTNATIEVKRGDNMLELPAGNYVVAGAFTEFQHAEDFSDELFQKGYHETIVGYSSARGYYYVVTYRSDDLRKAQQERDREKTKPGMSKVWVLKVSN